LISLKKSFLLLGAVLTEKIVCSEGSKTAISHKLQVALQYSKEILLINTFSPHLILWFIRKAQIPGRPGTKIHVFKSMPIRSSASRKSLLQKFNFRSQAEQSSLFWILVICGNFTQRP
jgi:hypothetical protein